MPARLQVYTMHIKETSIEASFIAIFVSSTAAGNSGTPENKEMRYVTGARYQFVTNLVFVLVIWFLFVFSVFDFILH